MENFSSNFADQTYFGISARWHFLRFGRATEIDRFRRRSEKRRRNAKKMLSKEKAEKGERYSGLSLVGKMNC